MNNPHANPIMSWVLRWLRSTALPGKEHALIRYLDTELEMWPFDIDQQEASLRLFQKHFLVMNALYRLRVDFASEGLQLVIDPLGISLQALNRSHQSATLPATESPGNQPVAGEDQRDSALANYYLDWSNFKSATTESVENLLSQFWRRFANGDRLADARNVLGVGATATQADVQLAYRRLARRYHPDSGGDAAAFIEIREAYELLKPTLQTG